MLSIIEKFVPGTIKNLATQRDILTKIALDGPIGRRLIAEELKISERVMRSELAILKNRQFILTSNQGMTITSMGSSALTELNQILDDYYNYQGLEEKLAHKLAIQDTTIVSTGDQGVNNSLASETFKVIDRVLPRGKHTIAVMGGTTMKAVAEAFEESLSNDRDLTFVPARGGLGESVSIQANSIAARMAQNTHGKSFTLYAPDHLRHETYSLLVQEPGIKKTLNHLKHSSMVLFSIGDPVEMANRRGLSEEEINKVKEKGAVAEAFGEFVNPNGESIYKISRIGIDSMDLKHIPYIIATAGGKNKAKAIQAYCKTAPPHTILVTDESCAKEILNGGNPLK